MSYYIKQQFIKYNNPNEKFINLKGIVIHSTANIGATSLNHYNYWNSGDRQSSVHFIVDWIGNEIYQFIPEDRIAWHTGNWQGNREWLGIEMTETNSKEQFNIVWNKTVWFVADLCIRHNWNVDDNVWSHNGLRSLYSGIDHTDPYGYLQRMGRTWQELCTAIDNEIKRRKQQIQQTSSPSPTVPQPLEGVKKLMKNLVIYKNQPDQYPANILANYLHCPVAQIDDQFSSDMFDQVENVYQVGGESIDSRVKLVSGKDRYLTIIEVMKKIGKIK